MDEQSRRWLRELAGDGAGRHAASARLHALLLAGARSELVRRRGSHPLTGVEIDDLANQAADDAFVAVTAKLEQFRGESRFTTWAYRFVVLEVSAKLGRHFWMRPDVRLDSGEWEQLPDRFGIAPDEQAERRELIELVNRVVREQMTEHQRKVFVALVIQQVPLDALVEQLGSSRNAIYKVMFDARRKLRAAFDAYQMMGGTETAMDTEPAVQTGDAQ